MFETYFCKLEKKVTSTYTLIQIDNKKIILRKKYEQLNNMLPPSTSRRQIPQIKQFHENFASFFSDLWKKVRSLLWNVFKKEKMSF